jgi:hypothetical protein
MRKLLRVGGALIVLGSLICMATIAESAWTCSTQAGGTCMSVLGPVLGTAIVPGPKGQGYTRAEASADAMKVCNAAGWLCCRVTQCTGNDLCGACSKKLEAGLGNAVRSSTLVRTHVTQALAAWETCSRTNKCGVDALAKQVQASCMGMDNVGMAQCVKYALGNH